MSCVATWHHHKLLRWCTAAPLILKLLFPLFHGIRSSPCTCKCHAIYFGSWTGASHCADGGRFAWVERWLCSIMWVRLWCVAAHACMNLLHTLLFQSVKSVPWQFKARFLSQVCTIKTHLFWSRCFNVTLRHQYCHQEAPLMKPMAQGCAVTPSY